MNILALIIFAVALYKLLIWLNPDDIEPENIICDVCGYYCLGHGGIFCIDKPSLQRKDK